MGPWLQDGSMILHATGLHPPVWFGDQRVGNRATLRKGRDARFFIFLPVLNHIPSFGPSTFLTQIWDFMQKGLY